MSLDVCLYSEATEIPCICSECGFEHKRTHREEFYNANITHNLNKMAEAADIYTALWRPEEATPPYVYGADLVKVLSDGLERLEADPAKFEVFNASNGWGLYEHFVPFVRKYLNACKKYPTAKVGASR